MTPLHFSFQKNQLSIAADDNWLVAPEGRLEHGQSSGDLQPRVNLLRAI